MPQRRFFVSSGGRHPVEVQSATTPRLRMGWRVAIAGCLQLLLGIGAYAGEALTAESASLTSPPRMRIVASEFGVKEADIRAVLTSTSQELWRFFPSMTLEPIVIMHGGPITEFKRSDRHEIVVRLLTHDRLWCQYAYQFAHEFGHVLCGGQPGYQGNQWFEETLCETSSLFVLRAMARTWQHAPPYPHWSEYRDALRAYADEIIRSRTQLRDIHARGLAAFYRDHHQELEQQPNDRERNGAMAIVLLFLFEEQPEQWEAIRWLNQGPNPEGLSFEAYLRRWHNAAPPPRREFIATIAQLFGYSLR